MIRLYQNRYILAILRMDPKGIEPSTYRLISAALPVELRVLYVSFAHIEDRVNTYFKKESI